MPTPSEFQLQRAYVMWYCGVLFPKGHPREGEWQIFPAKVPGVVGWHTPNGGARSGVEAKQFKEMGVLAGIPDYWHLWGQLHGFEFKEPGGNGRLSKAQLDLHPRLIAAGATINVLDNLAEAKRLAFKLGLAVRNC